MNWRFTTIPQKNSKRKSILGIFLGYYEKWDSIRNFNIAKENGFEPFKKIWKGVFLTLKKLIIINMEYTTILSS